MDELFMKYLLFAFLSFLYISYYVYRDYRAANKYYKSYKKIVGKCSDAKFLKKLVRDEAEGCYDIHINAYRFKYSVDGVEYSAHREEEIFDMYWGNLGMVAETEVEIWVNPENPAETFIPVFDDNSKKSINALIVVTGLLFVCGLIVKSGV